jgi:hypothetical protein
MTSTRLAGHQVDNQRSPEWIRNTETENGSIGFNNNDVIASVCLYINKKNEGHTSIARGRHEHPS